ncbi:MAG: adenine-specific methyltransferase EcoRI family protein [Kiritimatiellae bacterium]|nr:adenine-specific methyltransferase EcoRI family protein [Kiritimatiellia bacterium]
MANKLLNDARQNKKDEFYTQLSDIENELRHYKEHFRGKTVLCNCDDPRVSNFFHYFAYQFEALGLKRLITTCYKNQTPDLFSQHDCERAISLVYDGDKNGNRVPDPEEIGIHPLQGDGDFRSAECIELLMQADIVVTNPPFSLFRQYVAQLMRFDKKFIIVGNQNAITYKEIFPLIMDNKVWLGYGFKGGAAHFISNYEDTASAGDHRAGMIRVSGVVWFTNLEIKKRNEELILFRNYSPEEYPKYFNYDAIEVGRVENIPCDYAGEMGVPLTFLDKYNPHQFEIVGQSLDLADMTVVKKRLGKSGGGPRFYLEQDGNLRRLYERIVIRRRKPA